MAGVGGTVGGMISGALNTAMNAATKPVQATQATIQPSDDIFSVDKTCSTAKPARHF